jgi:hypothetical protein
LVYQQQQQQALAHPAQSAPAQTAGTARLRLELQQRQQPGLLEDECHLLPEGECRLLYRGECLLLQWRQGCQVAGLSSCMLGGRTCLRSPNLLLLHRLLLVLQLRFLLSSLALGPSQGT